MQENKNNHTGGSLKISQEVLASIAGYTVMDMEGVAGLDTNSLNLPGWLMEKQNRPVSIEIVDDVATVNLRVIVKNGARISDLSKRIQTAVKEAVQSMTGIVVSRVNLVIAGVQFEENKVVRQEENEEKKAE